MEGAVSISLTSIFSSAHWRGCFPKFGAHLTCLRSSFLCPVRFTTTPRHFHPSFSCNPRRFTCAKCLTYSCATAHHGGDMKSGGLIASRLRELPTVNHLVTSSPAPLP